MSRDPYWNTTLGEKWPQPGDWAGEPNPFERDGNGSIKSVTAISRLIRENEAKARAMCRQAGERTSQWFDDNPR